jgi:3-hydroxyisobutyrate dehydrogenase-like beta-hydroxyacid dehydrogenase
MMKVGFIGLGSMGAPIARRLARSGFDVTGCDISPVMLEAFDEPGTKRSSDPLQTARDSDLLGVCVRTDEQLESLVDGGKLYEALGKGGTLILHSTVSPDLARKLAAQAKENGVGFLDVGVSGGGPAAIEGQLSLWIGGEDADVERARPWLEAIGKKLSHLGPVGRGQEGKLINNLVSIANYGMSAAIVDIGVSMGFERQRLIDALMAGSAQSFALGVGPRFVLPRDGTGAPSSFLGLHDLLKKDVDHAAELPTNETVALRSLVEAAGFMLARIRRAAAEAEGKPTPADPQTTVDGYFAAVRARDIDALMALYAEDATFTLPNGKSFTGKDTIRGVHQSVFDSGSPFPSPGARFVGAEGIAVEIEAQLPDGSVRNTTNHYRFDETGKILSLGVYARG